MNGMRMVVNDKDEPCLGGPASRVQAVIFLGSPSKGVERGLRQWVLSGVPLVPGGAVRRRGKVKKPRGKETIF